MKTKTNKNRFLINFWWLFSFNNLGYLFSIITLPVLISKFGYQDIGKVFTVQVVVLGMVAIANYSFVFYIPTQSKILSESNQVFKEQWNLIITVRSVFSVILSLVSLLIIGTYFIEYFMLWIFSLPLLFFKIINPTLFFNALEKNKYVLFIGFFSKLLFLFFVLIISDKDLINFYLGLSELLVVLYFLNHSKKPFFRLQIPSIKNLIQFLQKTFNLFLVNFFSILKPASILPLITYLFGPSYSTIYTLADKVINIFRGVSGAMFTSFFPIYNKEKISLTHIHVKTGVFVVLGLLLVVVLMIIGSPYLIYVLNNFHENKQATLVLRILSLSIPMFFIIIPLFSYLLELKKWHIILYFALLQLVVLTVFYLVFHDTLNEISIGFVLSEYTMLFGYALYILFQKKKLNLF